MLCRLKRPSILSPSPPFSSATSSATAIPPVCYLRLLSALSNSVQSSGHYQHKLCPEHTILFRLLNSFSGAQHLFDPPLSGKRSMVSCFICKACRMAILDEKQGMAVQVLSWGTKKILACCCEDLTGLSLDILNFQWDWCPQVGWWMILDEP